MERHHAGPGYWGSGEDDGSDGEEERKRESVRGHYVDDEDDLEDDDDGEMHDDIEIHDHEHARHGQSSKTRSHGISGSHVPTRPPTPHPVATRGKQTRRRKSPTPDLFDC
ncbi:MAG: hypothetical protein M1819_003030 [Sarea resinae]|nr:MAG: hypothetical protein M1819_003030 [Sarea resinae]